MKILITGADGQLGSELQRIAPSGVTIKAGDWRELDITDRASVLAACADFQPDWLINCAAYTQVDQAEQEPEKAAQINAEGAGNLAHAAAAQGFRMIQVSTDFIFDGLKSSPYLVSDDPAPRSVYGETKLNGELNVLREASDQAIIVRTAWVYSAFGNNFVKTMLQLMADRPALGIVADQVGTPSWAHNLADVIWKMVETDAASGIYHWTDAGVASWYDFAVAIQEEAMQLGLLEKQIPIDPIRTEDYPTPAARPAYSVLDKTSTLAALKIRGEHWRSALRDMLKDLKEQNNG